MEEELDAIEEGRLNWVDALREFQKKFEVDLARAKTEMRDVKREAIPTDQVCEKCGKPMVSNGGDSANSWPAPAIPSARTRAKSEASPRATPRTKAAPGLPPPPRGPR
jgi:DNA topoisomerase-1